MLAPRLLELPQDVRPLAQEARRSHDGLGAHNPAKPAPESPAPLDTIFRQDEAEAVARMLQIEEDRARTKAEELAKWSREKREKRAGEEEKKTALAAEKAKAADRQRRVAQRAFRNWCRLRRDNKYVSKVVVPAPETADEPRPTARPVVKKVSPALSHSLALNTHMHTLSTLSPLSPLCPPLL